MKFYILIFTLFSSIAINAMQTDPINPDIGHLETVVELPFRPGNVTASKKGEVFATVHPFAKQDLQLIKITGKKSFLSFPNDAWQTPKTKIPTETSFDSPLGTIIDSKDRIWVIDSGFRLEKTRLFAFDLSTGKNVFSFTIPMDVAPKRSFVQDLAIDDKRGWAFLADIANPGIIAVNLNAKKARRFSDYEGLQPEDIDMKIDNSTVYFQGKRARVGINPITLSNNGETLYFGAMNSTNWYSVPARFFRDQAEDSIIKKAIEKVGPKPISDGASTDAQGNHFFTNLSENGIDKLSNGSGLLEPFIRDARLDWPDNVHFGPDSWLYISVNQLHKMPVFYQNKDRKEDKGIPPYYIFRANTGTKGQVGR